MEKIKVGLIGLGGRGGWELENILCCRDDVTVTYLCDEYEDRVSHAAGFVLEKTGCRPDVTDDYKVLVASERVDVVIASSAWENHIPAALCAMEAGKNCAIEVGGAYSLYDCQRLVETHERTGRHCMMLENCCYDRNEMMVLNMVKNGLFGKIVFCEGGYMHDLRDEISRGDKYRHYRLRNYMNRNCENYPTHELGPIAKVLDINNGNRMVSLVSMASGAWGLNEYARSHGDVNEIERDFRFAQGDVVKTLIKCARGETITLTLDTTLPRHYSRGFTVRGTKGGFNEDGDYVFLDGVHGEWDHKHYGNAGEYYGKWEHPLWRDDAVASYTGGHGGMDWLVFEAFFDSVKRGVTPPIDTYDTASWMAITPLSEQSIATGSMPVAIPDFTGGRWTRRCDDKGNGDIYKGPFDLNRVPKI